MTAELGGLPVATRDVFSDEEVEAGAGTGSVAVDEVRMVVCRRAEAAFLSRVGLGCGAAVEGFGGSAVVGGFGPTTASPRVFISYAHDSDDHQEAVRDLWILLRGCGIDARLDLPAAERRQDWPLWMLEQIREADYVLVIASPAYRRRAEGTAAADEGRGVQFEAALLREELYRDRDAGMGKFLPVVLPGQSADDIPAYNCPPEDAHQLARHTLRELDEHDLSHLDKFTAAARLVVASRETAAFTLRTYPPSRWSRGRPRRGVRRRCTNVCSLTGRRHQWSTC